MTNDHHCPPEQGCFFSPAGTEGLPDRRGQHLLRVVLAPLGLFCSAWSLPSGGEDAHLNSSKTAEGTETRFNWLIGRAVIKKMCCAMRRTDFSNSVLTRRTVLRATVTWPNLLILKRSEIKLRKFEPYPCTQLLVPYWRNIVPCLVNHLLIFRNGTGNWASTQVLWFTLLG